MIKVSVIYLGVLNSVEAAALSERGEVMVERSTHQPEWQCPICWNEYMTSDVQCKLKCGHAFDRQCLVSWLEKSERCPVCSNPLSKKSVIRDCNWNCVNACR